jgi:hypothetical protein
MTRPDADREGPGSRVDPSRSYPHSPEALTTSPSLSASPAEDAGPTEVAALARELHADYSSREPKCAICGGEMEPYQLAPSRGALTWYCVAADRRRDAKHVERSEVPWPIDRAPDQRVVELTVQIINEHRATPSSSPAPGAPRSYAQVPLIDQLEASAASPPVGGAPAETDTIAPLSYAESVARGRAMERIAFPEADAPAEATQGLHIEALHAAASDLLHLAHGGECDPRTLREHAGALYAVAERIFQLAATVAETDQALRQMAEIAADACDARDHHRTARLAAEQRVQELLGGKTEKSGPAVPSQLESKSARDATGAT